MTLLWTDQRELFFDHSSASTLLGEGWISQVAFGSLLETKNILCIFLLKKDGGFCYFYEKKSRY